MLFWYIKINSERGRECSTYGGEGVLYRVLVEKSDR
jgi:hypothetical protein